MPAAKTRRPVVDALTAADVADLVEVALAPTQRAFFLDLEVSRKDAINAVSRHLGIEFSVISATTYTDAGIDGMVVICTTAYSAS